MTGNKQFVSIDDGLDFSIKHIESGEVFYDCDSVVELLNELNEERDYFERKKEYFLSKWSIAHVDNIQLRQENRELKKENEKLEKRLSLYELSGDEVHRHLHTHKIPTTTIANKRKVIPLDMRHRRY